MCIDIIFSTRLIVVIFLFSCGQLMELKWTVRVTVKEMVKVMMRKSEAFSAVQRSVLLKNFFCINQ